MIYVYALCDPPPPPAAGRGLGDRPLEELTAGPVAAVYSRHGARAVAAAPDDLWRHEGVVESLMADRAVLPVRFGTTLSDTDALRPVLTRSARELAAGLDLVRGRVELGVRVLGRPPRGDGDPRGVAVADGSSGRAYMRARLAEEQHRRGWDDCARGWAEDLHARLAAAACASTGRTLVTPELMLSGAYLVPVAEVETFRRRVAAVAHGRPDERVLCTGPWPAYHFVPQVPLAEPDHA